MDDLHAIHISGAIEQARDLVEKYVKPEIISLTEPKTGIEMLAAKLGDRIQPIPASTFDDYREHPLSRRGTAAMLSLDSLIDHVNRFKDLGSIIFADDNRDRPSITSVLDYHHAGEANLVAPRAGRHRSTFAFPLSDEWIAWAESNGPKKAMEMADFAAFLENRIIDVLYIIPGEDNLPEDLERLAQMSAPAPAAR